MPVEAVPVEMADLANELNRMLDRLQQDFQRLSDFSSDLAHELRTPISNLLTQTQVALSNRRDADTYRDILASNAEEFQRLARMVSDMLFLAKTEGGIQLPSKELFSAAQEAQALLDFYEAVADEKSIHMSLHGGSDILGDRLMFRRAVSNLLSNALRHTNTAGEVCIEISDTEVATKVTVENTGEEIDPKIMPRLFDRFYRADPSRAQPDSEGAGLGLAITRAIVEAHGGRIEVASAQGRTRFTLAFIKVRQT
jgi:two-component system heavy metal sensor histidine kinase CusS